MLNSKTGIQRRNMFGMVAGTAALGSLLADQAAGAQSPQPGGVNRNSAPSQLRITDMRAIRIASNFDYPIIRIDTNQGVYGLGEAPRCGQRRHGAGAQAAYRGQEPPEHRAHSGQRSQFRQPAPLRRRLQRPGHGFARHRGQGVRRAGLAADRLPVPRPRSLLLRHHGNRAIPKRYAARMAARKKMGFTFFKMDIRPWMIQKRPGAVEYPRRGHRQGTRRCTASIIQAVRDTIGWDQPLAADHFGPLDVNDSIRHARFFETV